MELKPIPEIGKKYNCYDDGKIRLSRHCIAEITKVVPFKQFAGMVDKKTYDELIGDQQHCDWLYAPTTDFVVIATMSGTCYNEDNPTAYFFRTKNGGWFSIDNWWAGRLDIDGTLTEGLIEELKEYCDKKDYDEIIKIFV